MYAAVLAALNLMSRGAVCAGKQSFGPTRVVQRAEVLPVEWAISWPTFTWVFRGGGRTVGSHTAAHWGRADVSVYIRG